MFTNTPILSLVLDIGERSEPKFPLSHNYAGTAGLLPLVNISAIDADWPPQRQHF